MDYIFKKSKYLLKSTTISAAAILLLAPFAMAESTTRMGSSNIVASDDAIRSQIDGSVVGRYCVAEFVTGQLNSVACGTTHPVHGEVVCTGSTCTVGGEFSGEVVNRPRVPALQERSK